MIWKDRCLQQSNNKSILIYGLEDTGINPNDSVIEIVSDKMDIKLDKKIVVIVLGTKNEKKRPVLVGFRHQWRYGIL